MSGVPDVPALPGDPVPFAPPLRLEWVDPRSLAEHPKNWKIHTTAQISALTDVIAEVGWAGAFLYNSRTKKLLDGHGRKKVAIDQGCDRVPVLIGDWPEDLEAKILLTLDPIASMAQPDPDALKALLAEVTTSSDHVAALFESLAESVMVPDPLPEPGAGGDEFDPKPVEAGPTRTAVGDLWVIGGKHRLFIGNCTDRPGVASLMGADRVEMVWTDPPYGVAIGDKNKLLNAMGPSHRIEENIVNDTLSESDLAAMLGAAFDSAVAYCRPGASWYVAAPAGPLHLIFAGEMKRRGILRQMLIWKKNNATFSPLGVSYHWRHEPIFYGWLPDAGHRYYGGRQQDTVWEIDRPAASPDHPTTKPLELVSRAVENSSLPGEIVLDLFLGSGTTLIASHRIGRVCYGCEIDPRYADVILKRCEAENLTCEKVESFGG